MKIITRILLIVIGLTLSSSLFAQKDTISDPKQLQSQVENPEKILNRLNNITISGYFQPQFVSAQKDAIVRIGAPNENPDKSFSRIGIRRGRLKTTYQEGLTTVVFQLDITERGVAARDAYLKIKDPWFKTSFLQTGLFFRPFGFEVGYSSSLRESPERSRIVTTLFPGERDLGASIQFRAKEGSPLNMFALETALMAGNGNAMETDSRRDFIAHLTGAYKIRKDLALAAGVSFYGGSVFQGTQNVYSMQDGGFVLNSDSDNEGKYAKRQYLGFDVQSTWTNSFGATQIRAEYIFGKQPGTEFSSVSPQSSIRSSLDTYLRKFSGGYIILIQDIGKLPLEGILKYDWYDPNTQVSGNNIGLNGTNETDVKFATIGVGMIWHAYKNVQLQTYYAIVTNERTTNLPAYVNDLKDNTFTVTLQFRY